MAAPTDGISAIPARSRAPTNKRRWFLAAICAAWCVGWPTLALESTRGLPGILDVSADRGAYDLLSLIYGGPDAALVVALFLVALASFRAMLGLAGRLDLDARAWSAIRWALSVRSARVALIAGAIVCAGVVFAPDSWHQAVDIAASCVAALTLVAVPFLSTHPASLLRDADVGGWHPYWPGLWALVAVASLALFANAGPALAAKVAGEIAGGWAQASVALALLPLQLALGLTASAVWFGYRRRASLLRAWAAFWRREFLCCYLALHAYALILGLLILVPPMVGTVVLIYIAPHYQAAAQAAGDSLPELLQGLAHLGLRMSPAASIYILLPFVGWGYFAIHRLVFREGLGGIPGPEASRAGRALLARPVSAGP